MFVTDEIIVICKGCGSKRAVRPEVCAKIKSAEDLEHLLKSGLISRCTCGAEKYDIHVRLPPEKQPS